MVVLPAGEFMMGSAADEPGRDPDESPQRRVRIARPFAVGKFEVTFAEWDACVAAGGCSHRPENEVRFSWIRTSGVGEAFESIEVDVRQPVARGNTPVMGVSWHDAKAYADWIARTTRKPYRLLSEAEWEYAARAGSAGAFWWGDDGEAGCDKANMADASLQDEFPGLRFSATRLASCRDGHAYVAPAGSFAANAFGLHDMAGNLWEWVEDCYRPSYADALSDGAAARADACRLRVARGGSWFDDPRYQRVANRNGFSPLDRPRIIGLRLARNLP